MQHHGGDLDLTFDLAIVTVILISCLGHISEIVKSRVVILVIGWEV